MASTGLVRSYVTVGQLEPSVHPEYTASIVTNGDDDVDMSRSNVSSISLSEGTGV